MRELSETAFYQISFALAALGEDGVVCDSDKLGWCFIDWALELNKQACAQGVLLYAIHAATEIARILGMDSKKEELEQLAQTLSEAAKTVFWEESCGFFLSGKDRQLCDWLCGLWRADAVLLPLQETAVLRHRARRGCRHLGCVPLRPGRAVLIGGERHA